MFCAQTSQILQQEMMNYAHCIRYSRQVNWPDLLVCIICSGFAAHGLLQELFRASKLHRHLLEILLSNLVTSEISGDFVHTFSVLMQLWEPF